VEATSSDFVQDRKAKKHPSKSRDKISDLAFRKGLVIVPCGKSCTRYFSPLNVPREQLDTGLEILEECIRAFDKDRVAKVDSSNSKFEERSSSDSLDLAHQ
jgi:4-aminobutyrate aminotransferase-like enzyme